MEEIYLQALKEGGNTPEKLRSYIKKYTKELFENRERVIDKAPISEKIKAEIRSRFS